ncbi:MAG: PIN domain-containing protein [Euryarchaeota archaeon]|nr:PIN domain-containing protein [Euryarchaeota archaeon]
MACLETTFLVDLLRGKSEVKVLKDELDRTERALTVAAPSVMELWLGAMLSGRPAAQRARIVELLSSLSVLPLDERSAKVAGEMEAELVQSGQRVEAQDIMIAAIAQVNGEKVVTRDQHFTRIPGITLLKY